MIRLEFTGTTPANSFGQSFGDADTIKIGRDASWADFAVPADETDVSRSHLLLKRTPGGSWRVEREKKNYVAVNGEPVEISAAVEDGDLLTLGNETGPSLKVSIEAAVTGSGLERTRTQDIVLTPFDLTKRLRKVSLKVYALALAVGCIAIYLVLMPRTKFRDADLDRLKDTAYLVVLSNPQGGKSGIGTAWPVGPHLLVTNAHVAEIFNQLTPKHGKMVVKAPGDSLPDGVSPAAYDVQGVRIHAGYTRFKQFLEQNYLGAVNFDGEYKTTSLPSAYDVALLDVGATVVLPKTLEIADAKTIRKLTAHDKLTYTGYPISCVDGEETKWISPTPESPEGHVTSIVNFLLFATGTPAENLLVKHNLPATGGASGSAIIGIDGKVVAILSGGTIVDLSPDGKSRCLKIPSAALINYAQRADLITELIEERDDATIPTREVYWRNQARQFGDHFAYIKQQLLAEAKLQSITSSDFSVTMEKNYSEPVLAAGNRVSFGVTAGYEYAVLVYANDRNELQIDLKIDGKSVAGNVSRWMPAVYITPGISGTAELVIYTKPATTIDYKVVVARGGAEAK